jgi:hypothetical protein
MSDFFGALELELHAAANRRPRRQVTLGQGLGALAAAALLALAVGVALAVSSGGDGGQGGPAQVTGGPKVDPVGTVIPKGEGTPPRSARSRVVATGTTPRIGTWQMEVSRSTVLKSDSGEVYQPAGLRCLSLFVVGRGAGRHFGSGQCGEFGQTPGFSRLQLARVVLQGRVRRNRRLLRAPILVYGRAPESATRVVVTAPDGLRLETTPLEGPEGARGDFYALAVPQHHPRARVNWLDASGEPGSRGLALLPPITR